MNPPLKETIRCPGCGGSQDVTVWGRIDVADNPDLKSNLLDGGLGRDKCRACGHLIEIRHDLLYHDSEKHLAIWLRHLDDESVLGVVDLPTIVDESLSDDYVRRIVHSYQELVEKVRIVDAGLDDFEVELIKLIICIREQIDIASPFLFGSLRKSLMGGPSIVFAQPGQSSAGDKIYPLQGLRTTMVGVVDKLKQFSQDDDPWPNVNREFVLKRLCDAGLMKRME